MIEYDVVGIGNAIVDVLAKVEDVFLEKYILTKSSMSLIDEKTAGIIYKDMSDVTKKSGGSAANTMACIASFSGKAAFIGKVKNDELGQIFTQDIRSVGVAYNTPASDLGPATAKCLIAITYDAQRTMCTYLGATKNITVNDIDTNLISSSKVTYLEGYLWDAQNAKDAISFAIDIAKKNGRKVAMSLSDSFCVARHREEFLELIKENIDILFANEDEIKCLFQSDDLTDSISKISKIVDIAAITLGEKGSIIANGLDIYTIDAQNNIKVIDTTGAGDLYAGGFLFGYTNGYSIRQSAALGTLAASHVIQHIGARPKIKLVDLIREVA